MLPRNVLGICQNNVYFQHNKHLALGNEREARMLRESRAKERDDGFPIKSFSSSAKREKTNRAGGRAEFSTSAKLLHTFVCARRLIFEARSVCCLKRVRCLSEVPF